MTKEYVDVLIVGAGLSGIGAACHLKQHLPDKHFAILESRERVGGTWDLFRYPGIRSDSDMYTLGYKFKPWQERQSIAQGQDIRHYINEAAQENDVNKHIRFKHRVISANWDSSLARWDVEVETANGSIEMCCHFLWMCCGYYNYDHGYVPDFPQMEAFKGEFIHPQLWPEDIDYSGKKIVVIGSGATAVTLVPALAEKAAHVTMLQRSPTYILAMPDKDLVASLLYKLMPRKLAYQLTRWKNVSLSTLLFQLSRRKPEWVKYALRKRLEKELGESIDIDKHFKPTYDPWDQRLCLVPNGDLFKSIKVGKSSVITDHIKSFEAKGLQLKSGEFIEADIIVSATGLDLLAFGGAQFKVDGQPVKLSNTTSYKGMMLTGLPNMAAVFGYTNASWTLKADLISEHVVKLLKYMDKSSYDYCVPALADETIEHKPFLDLSAGYVQRKIKNFPTQGSKSPWKLHQNYFLDKLDFGWGRVNDEGIQFFNLDQKVGASIKVAPTADQDKIDEEAA